MKKPLASIKTILTLMKNPVVGSLNPQGLDAVHVGEEAVFYMQAILDDLLSLAKLEAGIQPLEKKNVQIENVIRLVLDRLKYDINEKQIKITVKAETIVFADEKYMHKLFMNLIGNAINYMGDKQTKEISVGVSVKENECLFYVKDTGIGIPEESQKEIFEKFKRGKNTTGISGTGLGLSIVKNTVEAHNGKIWLESKEGEGTVFYFTLPIAEP